MDGCLRPGHLGELVTRFVAPEPESLISLHGPLAETLKTRSTGFMIYAVVASTRAVSQLFPGFVLVSQSSRALVRFRVWPG